MPTGIYKRTEEHRQKISLTFKGRKHSDETKRKMSLAHKGKKLSPEMKKKWSLVQKGKKLTQETKQKMSLARKGTHPSEETKKRMSLAQKGANNNNWKGGKTKTVKGYILILMPEHPFTLVTGYILRSHLVMEKILGRYLKPGEIVHHINCIVDDDSSENLQLFPNGGAHTKFHLSEII